MSLRIPERYSQAYGDIGRCLANTLSSFSYDVLGIISGYLIYKTASRNQIPAHLYSWKSFDDIPMPPWHMSCDPLGQIWISKRNGGCIQVFDLNGTHLFTVKDTPIYFPCQIAFDRQRQRALVLGGSFYEQILELDLQGQYQRMIYILDLKDLPGNCYVTYHDYTDQIVILNSREHFLRVFSRDGKRVGESSSFKISSHAQTYKTEPLDLEYALTVGKDKYVYVMDTHHNRILVVSITYWDIVRTINCEITCNGPWDRCEYPRSIAIDSNNQVYFCFPDKNRVFVFSTTDYQAYVTHFGDFSIKDEKSSGASFLAPVQICLGPANEIIVWSAHGQVHIFGFRGISTEARTFIKCKRRPLRALVDPLDSLCS